MSSETPYRADGSWGRDKDGLHEWIVAVKATFEIRPDGSLAVAEEQLDPLLAPEYSGEPGMSSLCYDADLVAPKPTTDMVLNATAYAPGGRPSTHFMAGLRIGPLTKVIRVVGDRTWVDGPLGGVPSEPLPVAQVPITWERAYGGYDHADPDPRNHRLDTRNPVGTGIGSRIGDPAPVFEYPGGGLEGGPAGFGAIDSFWSPRRELQGTYDQAWEEGRMPLLPEDWDPRSLLCSPPDQRPATWLHGGELIELANLTPGGHLRFVLPKVYLTFRTAFSTRTGTRTEEHRGRLSTVVIEPDHPRVIMVWTSALQVRRDPDYLDETVVREKPYR
ncbi:MAG TPA: DUF2169 domain-containing protein [Longimicrobium sp.]